MKSSRKSSYRKSIASLGIFFLFIASGVSCAQTESSQRGTKAKPGEAVYKARCVLCHGSDGHSQTALGKQLTALDLHSPEVQKQTDAEMKNVILHGQKSMPPFDGQLTGAEIDQLVSYVREFGKKKK